MEVSLFDLAERISAHLRNHYEKSGKLTSLEKILESNCASNEFFDLSIPYDELEEVLKLSGGEVLKNTDEYKDCLVKTGEDKFKIYTEFIMDRDLNKERPRSYFDVLHEFGHACLELKSMEINDTCHCTGYTKSDAAAWYFARTFAMPRERFEEAIFRNGFNAIAVAKAFKLDYMPVMLRGKELNIWK